jgi:hypothetical protein
VRCVGRLPEQRRTAAARRAFVKVLEHRFGEMRGQVKKH